MCRDQDLCTVEESHPYHLHPKDLNSSLMGSAQESAFVTNIVVILTKIMDPTVRHRDLG